jgi:hypothetical protein
MMAVTRAAAEFGVSPVRKSFDHENARLQREVERLQQENDDLRQSADIWIRLYERQLARAKTLAELLSRCTAALPR